MQLTQSDDGQGGLAASPDGKWLYFTQDKGGNEYTDVYRVPVRGGAVEQLTDTPDIQEGGLIFARDGRAVLSHKLKTQAQANVAVLDPGGRVRLLTHEADARWTWTPIGWTDGDRTIIANRQRSDKLAQEVWAIDAASGRAAPVLVRADTVYRAEEISPDGRLLAVTSNEGSGQLHAGLYDRGAHQWRWLPPSPWEQVAGPFIDHGRAFLVTASQDSRFELIRVEISSMRATPLSLPPGVNDLIGYQPLAPDGRHVLATHAAANAPGDVHIVDLAASSEHPLTQLAMASLTPDQLPSSRVVTFRSFDGTLVSAVVTLPFNARRDGSNPAIVMPHGGPNAQAIDGFRGDVAALASRGYFVIQPNFRGSTGYGEAFQRANVRDYGGGDLKDVLAAKEFLVATGYVDSRRVGIYGGSYGGFMTLMAIGRAPHAFAAAVEFYGIIDWRTMYKEEDDRLKEYQRSQLGTPEDSPAVYDAVSPLTYIRAARAPLLTLQGENDIRVPRSQTQQVHDILKAKGATMESVFYPPRGTASASARIRSTRCSA